MPREDRQRTNVHEIRSVVTGFLTPTYVAIDDYGRPLNAFSSPEDIKRIQAGYACGDCCATFASFQLKCPVCHLPLNVTGQMTDAPADWQSHYDDHNYGGDAIPTLGPGGRAALDEPAPTPRTIDEFIAAVQADSDIDQTSMKGLMPSKKHRKG